LKAYFGGDFSEEAIRNNFVFIYELMDEIVDHGYPQTMEAEVLKMYITQEGIKSDMAVEDSSKVTIQATGAITWRREGIHYRKNEVYLDAVEQVHALFSNKGTVLNSHVNGQILMKSFLSGMPECKFGLNDRVVLEKSAHHATSPQKTHGIEIEDITFHQCVKLGRFDNDRTISFVPPDGEFELMRYRVTENTILPFVLHPPIIRELGRTRLEVQLTVKSAFSSHLEATNVALWIPCPQNTANTKIQTTAGRAKYEAEEGCIVWRIRRFPGNANYSLTGEVELVASTSGKSTWSRPPIRMEFQVHMCAASGLRVRFLKVYEKSNYQTIKWVRYVTKGGEYQQRI
jgi:AP-2 complex subunit mu-1